MVYATWTPEELLSRGFSAPEVTDRRWCVRWDATGQDNGNLVSAMVPPVVDFHTSGSTGPSRCWRRTREKVWYEAGVLAELVEPEGPEAVLSFVPPVHLFGALTSVLVPARLRLPVWYRSGFTGPMPDTGRRRLVVMATPWIFSLLLERMAWVRSLEQISVLYGGAMLPAKAGEFLTEAGPDRALIVEVLGSTEAGGIATRRWRAGEPPAWTLFRDVTFAAAGATAETLLAVRSPRLAFRPGESPPDTWTADDWIQPLDDRRFRLLGRRGRLVKVNGRRLNLDEAEHAMRAVLDCEDLALMPVEDPMIGEHVDLLIVPSGERGLAGLDLSLAFQRLGVRPRRVHAVTRIERSELGKLRHSRLSTTNTTEVATP
ncbi:AMP-binding protein [Amycolatopsis lurida]